MLPTVPDAPPEAGPDRALDPLPLDPRPPVGPRPATRRPAVDDGDVARSTESPITEHISTATTIHLLLLFDSNRRTVGRRARLAIGTEADQSGEDTGGGSGAAPASPELPAIDCSDVALAGRPARVSWGLVDSYS